MSELQRESTILFERADERILYAVALEPEVVDTYGTKASEMEIRKAAHGFLVDRGELVNEHRVHPADWPDGVDALIFEDPATGMAAVQEVRFDKNKGWDEDRARLWMMANGQSRGRLDDGPVRAELVESFLAPEAMETMHGEKLATPVPRGTWIIGARLSEKEWAERDQYTGVSIGGTAKRA